MNKAAIAILLSTLALLQTGCGGGNIQKEVNSRDKISTTIEKETEKESSINTDNLMPSQVIINNKIINWDTTFKEFVDQLNFDAEVFIGYKEHVDLDDAYKMYSIPEKSRGNISIHSKDIDLSYKVGLVYLGGIQ